MYGNKIHLLDAKEYIGYGHNALILNGSEFAILNRAYSLLTHPVWIGVTTK